MPFAASSKEYEEPMPKKSPVPSFILTSTMARSLCAVMDLQHQHLNCKGISGTSPLSPTKEEKRGGSGVGDGSKFKGASGGLGENMHT